MKAIKKNNYGLGLCPVFHLLSLPLITLPPVAVAEPLYPPLPPMPFKISLPPLALPVIEIELLP
ncbi:MAG TPA: hypothetical protein VIY08_02250 [Candidatus Nitrosocosmicus sp.]